MTRKGQSVLLPERTATRPRKSASWSKAQNEEENHISERCFEFLNQAEIEFDLKDRLYRTIQEGSDRLILLSQLQTMDLDPDLLGALTEIITA